MYRTHQLNNAFYCLGLGTVIWVTLSSNITQTLSEQTAVQINNQNVNPIQFVEFASEVVRTPDLVTNFAIPGGDMHQILRTNLSSFSGLGEAVSGASVSNLPSRETAPPRKHIVHSLLKTNHLLASRLQSDFCLATKEEAVYPAWLNYAHDR